MRACVRVCVCVCLCVCVGGGRAAKLGVACFPCTVALEKHAMS